MRIPQTASQALDILRQAEASGRSVTVNKRGEVAFAGRGTMLLEGLRARIHGDNWRAEREVERHQRVLDAFGTALSRDFQPESGNVRLSKAYEGVVKDIGYTFRQDYRNGVLPEASRIAQELSSSLAKALGKYDMRQYELSQRAVTEFVDGTPPEATRKKLDDIARGAETGGGDGRVELDALRQALQARTEELSEAYAKNSAPTDQQATELRDHVRALAHLSSAIDSAVEASRRVDQSRVPRFDGGGVRERVRFAGVDNPANTVTDALDGAEIRAKRKSKTPSELPTLFARGLEDNETREAAESQPIAEGAGLRGSQARTEAEVAAANRLWQNYDDEDANPDLRSVAEVARDVVRAPQAPAPSAPSAATRPVPADTWIVGAYAADAPIMKALRESPLKDREDLHRRVINAYVAVLVRESDASTERRLIGYTPAEVEAIARDTVQRFLPPAGTA